jgi:hypothetical protein
MTEKEELEIHIGADGEVTIEVIGGAGNSCLRLTKELEQALGTVADRQILTDFYAGDKGDNEVFVGEDDS